MHVLEQVDRNIGFHHCHFGEKVKYLHNHISRAEIRARLRHISRAEIRARLRHISRAEIRARLRHISRAEIRAITKTHLWGRD